MDNTFKTEIILPNENERLAALRRYRILGTYAEKSFTSIASLVSKIFDASMAMISLVEDETVYFESNVGMQTTSGPRSVSFCSLTILNGHVNVIEDALEDPVVAGNPLVCGDFGLRFYAGAPLITHDGYKIGTVCLVDTKPRKFSVQDRAVLEGMARVVMEQIELRLTNLEIIGEQAVVNEQLAQSNNRLFASERRFQYILDTMAEAVVISDTAGKMVYTNLMAQRILGLGQGEIKDSTFDHPRWQNLRVDGSPLPYDEHPMIVMMKTGLPVYDQEIAIQPYDAERFYISINAAPLIDPDTGVLTGGIATFMDVTNRRRVLQQKEEFINVASHELKTPVTSLKAAVQIITRMKDNINPVVFSSMIAQANKSLDKLTGLITDLLDSNRISKGQLHLRKTMFEIGVLVNDCCSHIRTDGTHDIVLQGDMHLKVYADEQQIDQVLVNLVNNAVKYAPDSGNIYIISEQMENAVKVAVRDNGPGIPPEKIPYLFEQYYRADYSGVQFSGLGLGLYICSEIIKKHDGKIGVESEPGKGSTFWFTLPIATE